MSFWDEITRLVQQSRQPLANPAAELGRSFAQTAAPIPTPQEAKDTIGQLLGLMFGIPSSYDSLGTQMKQSAIAHPIAAAQAAGSAMRANPAAAVGSGLAMALPFLHEGPFYPSPPYHAYEGVSWVTTDAEKAAHAALRAKNLWPPEDPLAPIPAPRSVQIAPRNPLVLNEPEFDKLIQNGRTSKQFYANMRSQGFDAIAVRRPDGHMDIAHLYPKEPR